MSDSYDDYEAKIQLAEQAWEKRVVKNEHNKQLEIAQAYERGWNAALAQQEPMGRMNREDIIRMAREAGFEVYETDVWITDGWWLEELERFAALVAKHEREACARLCDQMFHDWCNQEFEDEDEAYRNKPDAEDCKKAIRERGNK